MSSVSLTRPRSRRPRCLAQTSVPSGRKKVPPFLVNSRLLFQSRKAKTPRYREDRWKGLTRLLATMNTHDGEENIVFLLPSSAGGPPRDDEEMGDATPVAIPSPPVAFPSKHPHRPPPFPRLRPPGVSSVSSPSPTSPARCTQWAATTRSLRKRMNYPAATPPIGPPVERSMDSR